MIYDRLTSILDGDTIVVAQNSGDVAIVLDINEEIIDMYNYYLDIALPKNNKFVSPKLVNSNGALCVLLSSGLTAQVGDCYGQLIARDKTSGNIVWKSKISSSAFIQVQQSINAVEQIKEDDVKDCLSDVDKLISKYEAQVQSQLELIAVKANEEDLKSGFALINGEIEAVKSILKVDNVSLDTLQEIMLMV